MSVVDVIFDTSVLSNASHTDAVRAVTVNVGYQYVRGIWLGAEAIVSDVDPRVSHCKSVDVIAIPAIGILWQVLSYVRYNAN